MAVEKKKVVVVHGVFMLRGSYVAPGQVISDEDDVAWCLENHRDKVVPSVHDFDESGQDVGEERPSEEGPEELPLDHRG